MFKHVDTDTHTHTDTHSIKHTILCYKLTMFFVRFRGSTCSDMATLPIKPATGLEKPVEKSLVALIKGCLPHCRVDDFPADPEKACKRQRNFLALWYNTGSMRKPEERKAFAEACPHLSKSEVKQIVNNVHDYKSFLRRKNRNQKTGEKTKPVFKGLFQAILGNKSQELAQGLEKK